MFIAFMVMVPRYLAAQRQRLTLDKETTGSSAQLELAALQIPAREIRNSRFFAMGGTLFMFGITEFIEILKGADLAELIYFYSYAHNGTVTLPLTLTMGWVLGRGGYLTFASISTDNLRLPTSTEIDLLSLEHLYIMGRSGLPGSLVWLLTISIASLLFLDTPIGLWGTLPAFTLGLVMGLVILLGPARKVRDLIRTAKRNELDRLSSKIVKTRDKVLQDDVSTQGQLTDLLAYKTSIISTPEWSFDPPTLMRFGLYLLIPVGSMVGGAFVERFIDSLVG